MCNYSSVNTQASVYCNLLFKTPKPATQRYLNTKILRKQVGIRLTLRCWNIEDNRERLQPLSIPACLDTFWSKPKKKRLKLSTQFYLILWEIKKSISSSWYSVKEKSYPACSKSSAITLRSSPFTITSVAPCSLSSSISKSDVCLWIGRSTI